MTLLLLLACAPPTLDTGPNYGACEPGGGSVYADWPWRLDEACEHIATDECEPDSIDKHCAIITAQTGDNLCPYCEDASDVLP